VTEAVAVTAEVTAGAIEATGKIAAAAADVAQSAAETLGAIATGAAPDRGVEDGMDGGGRAYSQSPSRKTRQRRASDGGGTI
jgi:hypothetical protein